MKRVAKFVILLSIVLSGNAVAMKMKLPYNKSGLTPLHVGIENKMYLVSGIYLNNDVDVNSRTRVTNKTLLHSAVEGENIKDLELLLGKDGIDLNPHDNEGATPLIRAVMGNNSQIVSMLLSHGADVNRAHTSGASPLFIASLLGHSSMVDQLLQAHARVDQVTLHNQTPLDAATSKGHTEIIERLVQAGAVNRQ